jgi:hypothetical protein
MNTETVDNKKVIENLVAAKRPELNAFGGASFGSKFFKTEPRLSILNFEELKHNIESNGNVDFMLNRSPRRITIKDYDIVSMEVGTNAENATMLILNKEKDGEVRIPFGFQNDQPVFTKVTDDALGKALRGDGGIIFSDAKKLCDQVNAINLAEKQRLTKLIEDVKRMIQGIDSTINDNTRKANEYIKQLIRTSETSEGEEVIVAPSGAALANGTVIVNA